MLEWPYPNKDQLQTKIRCLNPQMANFGKIWSPNNDHVSSKTKHFVFQWWSWFTCLTNIHLMWFTCRFLVHSLIKFRPWLSNHMLDFYATDPLCSVNLVQRLGRWRPCRYSIIYISCPDVHYCHPLSLLPASYSFISLDI